MGRVTKFLGYFFGIIIMLFGFVWLIWTMSLPMIFAGEYVLIGVIIVIFGFAVVYLGHKSGRKKVNLPP